MRCCCLLQNLRIENNQLATADMVLQLLRYIGPGWRTDQIIVYCSFCRIDVDSGFKAGLNILSPRAFTRQISSACASVLIPIVSVGPYAVFPAVRTFVHSDRFCTWGWLHPELILKRPFGVPP